MYGWYEQHLEYNFIRVSYVDYIHSEQIVVRVVYDFEYIKDVCGQKFLYGVVHIVVDMWVEAHIIVQSVFE